MKTYETFKLFNEKASVHNEEIISPGRWNIYTQVPTPQQVQHFLRTKYDASFHFPRAPLTTWAPCWDRYPSLWADRVPVHCISILGYRTESYLGSEGLTASWPDSVDGYSSTECPVASYASKQLCAVLGLPAWYIWM